MKKQLDHEIEGWNIYYDSLINLSELVEVFKQDDSREFNQIW